MTLSIQLSIARSIRSELERLHAESAEVEAQLRDDKEHGWAAFPDHVEYELRVALRYAGDWIEQLELKGAKA